MVIQKPWYKSKTIWASVVTISIGLLAYLIGYSTVGGSATLLGFVYLVLRLVTNSQIGVNVDLAPSGKQKPEEEPQATPLITVIVNP
jgi:hypothetical protein